MKKQDFMQLLKIAGLSLILFLATCWTGGISFALAATVEGLCFFVFTRYCCENFRSETLRCWQIALAIIVGSCIIELPLRVNDFAGTLVSASVPIMRVIGIVLGAVCCNRNKVLVLLLCVAAIPICSYFLCDGWFTFWLENFKR